MEPAEIRQMFALEESHWWYRALHRRILAALDRSGALAPPPPACLDAGCGTGMLLARLDRRVRGSGLDHSALALALARRRGLPHLLRGSVEALPVASASQAIIVSADVLYHQGVTDDQQALREFSRCLMPGGLLVLNLPAFNRLRSTHDEAVHTARRYTARAVRRKLAASGLLPLRVRYWNWLLFGPIALRRLRHRRPVTSSGRGARAAPEPSDLAPLPAWLNGLLAALMRAEEALDWAAPPFGLSVLAVARKPAPRSAGGGA